jgi:hypothetical protein
MSTHAAARLANWETKQRCECGEQFATRRELAEHVAHPDPCQGYFCLVCFPEDWPGTHENPPRPKPVPTSQRQVIG